MEINWQQIDTKVEHYNRYHDLKRKIRQLKEYYKNLKYYGT